MKPVTFFSIVFLFLFYCEFRLKLKKMLPASFTGQRVYDSLLSAIYSSIGLAKSEPNSVEFRQFERIQSFGGIW